MAVALEFKISLSSMTKKSVSAKNTKINRLWWHAHVVSATWEAEVGGSLEPRRSRLQQVVIVPLHSSLGHIVRPCLRKKKEEE